MIAVSKDYGRQGKRQGKDRMAEFDHAAEIHNLSGQGGCGSASPGSAGFQKIPGADAALQVIEKRIQQNPEKAHGDDADKQNPHIFYRRISQHPLIVDDTEHKNRADQ